MVYSLQMCNIGVHKMDGSPNRQFAPLRMYMERQRMGNIVV